MPVTTTQYEFIKGLVFRGMGFSSASEFNRNFSSTSDTATSDIFNEYLRVGAEIVGAAHPDGFPWQKRIPFAFNGKTQQVTISLTTSGSPWYGKKTIPKDMGFFQVQTKRGASGTWIPCERVTPDEARNRGYFNRTAIASGQVPTAWCTQRDDEAATFTLEFFPYTFEAADEVYVDAPHRVQIPAIDGTDDTQLIWGDDNSIYNMPISLAARLFTAAQRQQWNLYAGTKDLLLMNLESMLLDMGVHAIGEEFQRWMTRLDMLKDLG